MEKRALLLFGLALLLGLMGCSSETQENGPTENRLAALSKEAENIPVQLPDFALQAPPQAQEAYRLAYAHSDVLKHMPCYCGCGSSGHKHNAHCFIKDKGEDGNVAWDRMGAT
ncbi:Protein of unknown function with PCYCGC motif-containing protein [Melghirimyces algeriensis]|uniref:Lipoprotein n=2 Tax=Melghirimyces algeriensis TaxID=910412 RepID=A0A521AH63_9BACL|nr:Protein of unknown function with PCYCGC motif-containing protein [Melghirimyces algeriensis]